MKTTKFTALFTVIALTGFSCKLGTSSVLNTSLLAYLAQVASGSAPAVRVYHTSAQALANGTATALAFNSERFDTGSMHDTAANTTRLTAPSAGKYLIIGHVRFATSGDTTNRSLWVRLNGTTAIGEVEAPAGGGTQPLKMNVTTLYQLNAGDYVELVALQNTGGALNIDVIANSSPEFMMIRSGD